MFPIIRIINEFSSNYYTNHTQLISYIKTPLRHIIITLYTNKHNFTDKYNIMITHNEKKNGNT